MKILNKAGSHENAIRKKLSENPRVHQLYFAPWKSFTFIF